MCNDSTWVSTISDSISVKLKPNLNASIMVYFETSKFNLSKEYKSNIDLFIKSLLQLNPNAKLLVSGYADYRGSEALNKILSTNRANACVKYLTQNGISKKNITFKGEGENNSISNCNENSNCTDEQLMQDRRVVVKIVE